jgi:hypothetical protein
MGDHARCILGGRSSGISREYSRTVKQLPICGWAGTWLPSTHSQADRPENMGYLWDTELLVVSPHDATPVSGRIGHHVSGRNSPEITSTTGREGGSPAIRRAACSRVPRCRRAARAELRTPRTGRPRDRSTHDRARHAANPQPRVARPPCQPRPGFRRGAPTGNVAACSKPTRSSSGATARAGARRPGPRRVHGHRLRQRPAAAQRPRMAEDGRRLAAAASR